MMKQFLVPFLVFLLVSVGHSKSPERDHQLNLEAQEECRHIARLAVGGKYTVECFFNYHHYNSNAARNHYRKGETINQGEIKIGAFNLWHPGSLRSAYKDYELVAKIMNQWDVIGATELLASVGREADINQRVLQFLEQAPIEIQRMEEMLKNGEGNSTRLEQRLQKMKRDLRDAPSLYREPGYLLLLDELRRLDPSWALILTPRGDAAQPHNMHELTGFYYRGSRVRPVVNQHCDEFLVRGPTEQSDYGPAFACYPYLGERYMGRDTNGVFSRRPFLASFQSGQLDYHLLASHIIFGSPSDEERMAQILMPTFGVEDYHDIGTGVNAQTYARWAEMKVTLELMDRLESDYQKDHIIYLGDTNLPSRNQYWSQMLEKFIGFEVFVTDPTTLSPGRYYIDGTPTNGAGNDYDHFIFRPERTSRCVGEDGVNAQVFYYHLEPLSRDFVYERYLIRDYRKSDDHFDFQKQDVSPRRDYVMKPGAEYKMNRQLAQKERLLKSLRTIRNMEIVWDSHRFNVALKYFKNRVFLDQLVNRFFYRVYMETISDHYPIWMSCRTN